MSDPTDYAALRLTALAGIVAPQYVRDEFMAGINAKAIVAIDALAARVASLEAELAEARESHDRAWQHVGDMKLALAEWLVRAERAEAALREAAENAEPWLDDLGANALAHQTVTIARAYFAAATGEAETERDQGGDGPLLGFSPEGCERQPLVDPAPRSVSAFGGERVV